MTAYYGAHFQEFPESVVDLGVQAPSGLGHSRLRQKRMDFNTTASGPGSFDPVITDLMVFGKMQSTDRIHRLNLTGSSGWDVTWTMDIGLWRLANDVLVAIDANIFADAVDAVSAGELEVYTEAALTDLDRGTRLMDLTTVVAALGADYPPETWFIVGELTDAVPIASGADQSFLIVQYVSGD